MGFEIIKTDEQHTTITSDAQLWVTADGMTLVEDGHEDAAFLMYRAGEPIPKAEAIRFGLIDPEPEQTEPEQTEPSGRGRSGRGK